MSPTYEQHHLGRLIPPMPEVDFNRLRADIRQQGLLEEIILYQGQILDGWSRYRACQQEHVEPRFQEFTGDNPVAYVLAKNIQRRHLNPVQILKVLERAREPLEAEAVARMRSGKQAGSHSAAPPSLNLSYPGKVAEQIAEMAGVSSSTAEHYHAVQVHGSAELKEAVDREEVSISDAAEVARHQPAARQRAAVRRVRAGSAKTLREATQEDEVHAPTRDGLELPIPDCLVDVFNAAGKFKEARSSIARVKRLMGEIRSGRAGTLLKEDGQVLCAQLRRQLDDAEAYTVCPDCLGRGCPPETNDGQPLCHGGGFISRRQYRHLPPAAQARILNRAPAN
jgi:hypothetical protein